MLTISSFDNILEEREPLIPNMFPESIYDSVSSRPYKFKNKPYIFISSRVHPGETPSSFVLNGILKFLTDENNE